MSREVPLVELRILGGLNLLGAGGRELSSVLAQPKRVALLAYLAAATPRRLHRRDSLLALFWPELDQEHARAALRQALHGLRHALGDGVLVTRGDEDIGLDAERIRCDVVEFARAAEVGRLADALDLYRGDLLEGFFIRGAPEFEQWLEDERARLKAVALRSATQLAERTEGHGDLAEAILDVLPPERTHEVCYLNVADTDNKPPQRPLRTEPPPLSTDKSIKYDYDIVYVRASRFVKGSDGKEQQAQVWPNAGEPENLDFSAIEWAPRETLPQYDFLEGDVEFVRRLAGNPPGSP